MKLTKSANFSTTILFTSISRLQFDIILHILRGDTPRRTYFDSGDIWSLATSIISHWMIGIAIGGNLMYPHCHSNCSNH